MTHPEVAARSLRWVVDLQACQTEGSAHRGVGRYSRALFDALRVSNEEIELHALLNSSLPHQPRELGLSGDRILRLGDWPRHVGKRKFAGGPQDDIDGVLLSHRLSTLKPDLIHVSHAFEGFGDRIPLPSPATKPAGQLLTATLYDFIPLLFSEHYFRDPAFEHWYHSRLDWLRQADLLLAISESSRQDAISLLGIRPDRVVTVYGGIGQQFSPAAGDPGEVAAFRLRFKLPSRYVLYTGGDDHRKNIAGAIRGYATLPASLRNDCCLVIVCSMDDSRKSAYAKVGQEAGLASNELIFTGYVSENDLVAFYRHCAAFVFPSLYEGLGLPVLEAMACGAPTIGGNNSSIKELIGRPDALFDAASSAEMGAVLSRVLSDQAFALDLARFGPNRARQFTWSRTASMASEAMLDALARVRQQGTQVAVAGWLPRKRLAVVTPLPPCRSGIADYNARFLPHLARHFDIDLIVDDYEVTDPRLTSTFPVFGKEHFEKTAHLYDAILYEFGNSEFHRYMLPLLQKFPGVVGLHDAFLSGLYGYLDFHLGDSGSYPRTMIAAHGSRARRFYAPVKAHPEPNGGTMVELPCTKPVLDMAIGLISHSPFNLEVARKNYPEGWQAPYRTIPQMVESPPAPTAESRAAARASMGIPSNAVVIATFGHIAWTKWGDRVLEAFLGSVLGRDSKVWLVYVGEMANDSFGQDLSRRIQRAGLGQRVRVTGFVEDADYVRYLYASDLAIQLRTKSRGGTPKGVLDCLAHGVPVIVNNDASYRDYPDDVVFKLPDEPSDEQIRAGLVELSRNDVLREQFAAKGREHVLAHHDPNVCAGMYAAAIHEFTSRHALSQSQAMVRALAPHLGRCAELEPAVSEVSRHIEQRPARLFRRRRIYVDVSYIAAKDYETGIQRVVKEVVLHGYTLDIAGIEVVAVQLVDGQLCVASDWLSRRGILHPSELDAQQPNQAIIFAPGDVLLMLDSSWERYAEFRQVFALARAAKAIIVTTVYDLLPMTMPEMFVEGGSEWFKNWFVDAVAQSDALVSISASMAKEIAAHIDGLDGLENRPHIGFWHLGSDVSRAAKQPASDAVQARVHGKRYLLMVGTVEPRKSHQLALDAMERLWAEGLELDLCVVGKQGWMMEELMDRMRALHQKGSRLHLFEGAPDSDLSFLYEHAAGLLFLSRGEGFGLPLVEAANHGIPIVCSDLPVFKEICGDFAYYVSAAEPKGIAAEIAGWWELCRKGKAVSTSQMPRLSWEGSARALIDVVAKEQWIY